MSFYSRFNLKKKISQLIRLANWIKITSKYGKFACDYISENSRFLRFLVLYLDEMKIVREISNLLPGRNLISQKDDDLDQINYRH
ncbi:hypothetical protein RIR_jg36214.t1 [Rhizophagus irregularis DAOM 181602=DAOM 197198]|nr:hypothetical protein RIR_jg36214.t1 [Rhizophagus irregularis DAOM 181602=DAOM 197198]